MNSFPDRIMIALLLAVSLFGCGMQESDEAILRKEFGVPAGAALLSCKVRPEKAGWFGREGLKIDISFQLNDKDFAGFVAEARKSGNWDAMPMAKPFLMRMGGIESAKRSLVISYKLRGEKLPEEGSVYNPSREQLYDNFLKSLPLKVNNGLYQCRTAGDDIMRKPKRIVRGGLEKDLNDFMLAIIDLDEKKLLIKVSTKY